MELRLEPCSPVTTTAVGDRILTAAARLFYERGITATAVDTIVDEAETTKRTLYQRFGSKNALVVAYLQQRAHRWQTELLAALADLSTDAPAADLLGVVYDQTARWAREGRRGCAFANAWVELEPVDEHAVAVIRAEKSWMRNLFTQTAGDEQQGALLHLLFEGAQVTAAIHQDQGVFGVALRSSRELVTD